jgi:Putative DNA-binding domain
MISKTLDEIGEIDLEALLSNGVSEGKTIEYKVSLPGNSDGDKKEFLADISSFANTSGGDLIFGVDEAQGVPISIPGLLLSDPDIEIRRLDSIINDGLDPRIRIATRTIQRNAKPPALIARIERSWIGPHRVVFKGYDKFFARSSAGKYPMDVSELRSAFTLTSSVAERVRSFRADRISRVGEDRTPVALDGKSRTVLHLIPLDSFARPAQYDVLKYSRPSHVAKFPPLVEGGSWGTRINLDGHLTYSAPSNASASYTQLFRGLAHPCRPLGNQGCPVLVAFCATGRGF